MNERVLVVEDEPDLATTLEYNLEREGFLPVMAATAQGALDRAAEEPPPALVLLDIMLPDGSGLDVCRRLRADPRTSGVPILFLTARGEEIDRVIGFEVGADDYVVKPFSPRELMLRVKAVLRRSRGDLDSDSLHFGDLKVDRAAHRAFVREQEIALTPLEFKLLVTLISRKGRAQSRATLLSDVWDIDAAVTTRTVDTHVKRLREKLGPTGHFVETVRGVGYRFRAELPAS